MARVSRILSALVEDALRPLTGPLGIRMRRIYYNWRLRSCGERLTIEPGVRFIRPEWISLGHDVWIDTGCVLIAGPPDGAAKFRRRGGPSEVMQGEIRIGNAAHLGIGSIIQGHGGVQIADAFTAGAHAKIYSYSNDHRACSSGTIPNASYRPFYVMTPVWIDRNVWVGINSVVIGHRIGENCFVKPGSVVTSDVEPNSIVAGNPAVRTGDRFVHQAGPTSQAAK